MHTWPCFAAPAALTLDVDVCTSLRDSSDIHAVVTIDNLRTELLNQGYEATRVDLVPITAYLTTDCAESKLVLPYLYYRWSIIHDGRVLERPCRTGTCGMHYQ